MAGVRAIVSAARPDRQRWTVCRPPTEASRLRP